MAKAISGYSAPKSGMAMAIAAIPVAPPLLMLEEEDIAKSYSREEADWI